MSSATWHERQNDERELIRDSIVNAIEPVDVHKLTWLEKLEAFNQCSVADSDALNAAINEGDPVTIKLVLETLIEEYHNEANAENALENIDYFD